MTGHTPPTVSNRPNCSRNVTAVLGPTNTGKTHLAIERMLGYETGLIGLPLRLLAREVYDKIVARAGAGNVALITGEEKIKPDSPRYYVCTVEAMPRNLDVDFVAVDEIQLAADPERGHVFTNRLLHARGQTETLLLGAATMQHAIRDLLPDANFVSRPRLSRLTYAGQKKLSRLPRRTAIVAFSANDVYAIAELIRRQRGGAAVVLGALSPRTRNAQVELYQSGEVDFLVATDAIGMGLNLDVDHVAFAGLRKFDGQVHRTLTAQETAQIAGRAGRHMNDGTFGVTGETEPFSQELIERLENHDFEPVKVLQWRNSDLDFGSIERLKESLREAPKSPRLTRARMSDDVIALENVSLDEDIRDMASSPAAVRILWEVCQIPDYRKISAASHADLIATLYKFLLSEEGIIPQDWVERQVRHAASTEGDIDTLANRISHIRTWTFIANRGDWLADPQYWQGRTREIEDNLSDALHQRLTQRFVDRRTSVLMKRLHDKTSLYAEIEKDGRIFVETHYVGRLHGFYYHPDTEATGAQGKAARHAAAKVLSQELADRAERLSVAKPAEFALTRTGALLWRGEEVGRLEASDDPLFPSVQLLADEHMSAPDREKVQQRLNTWLSFHIGTRIKPLVDLAKAEDISGLARGIAFRLIENFGSLRRDLIAEEVRSLDQPARAQLRKYGVRFGAYNIYFPALLKPDAAELLLLLWALKHGADVNMDLAQLPDPPRPGLTSLTADANLPEGFYRASGFHVCAGRAVRMDMLERLGDIIRPLTSWKPGGGAQEPPAGALGGGAFKVQPDMMSILGCSNDELSQVLKALGYRLERRPIRSKPRCGPQPSNPETQADQTGMETGSPLAQCEASNPEAAPESALPEASQNQSADAQPQPGSAAAGADEPQYEEIWHPGRMRSRSQRARAQDVRRKPEARNPAQKSFQQKRGGSGSASRKSARKPENRGAASNSPRRKGQRREVDPDSPFAALRGLKERLEREVRNQP